jgi:hypothetical protein
VEVEVECEFDPEPDEELFEVEESVLRSAGDIV